MVKFSTPRIAMALIKDYKPIELTVNIHKLTRNDSWRWKARQAVKRLKKFIRKYYKTDADVMISPELNKEIFKHGMKNPPGRVRIRVDSAVSSKDASKRVFRLSHIVVGGFKGLPTEAVVD